MVIVKHSALTERATGKHHSRAGYAVGIVLVTILGIALISESIAQGATPQHFVMSAQSPVGPNAAEDLGSHFDPVEVGRPAGWFLTRYFDSDIGHFFDVLVRQLTPITSNAPRLYIAITPNGEQPTAKLEFWMPQANKSGRCGSTIQLEGAICKVRLHSRSGGKEYSATLPALSIVLLGDFGIAMKSTPENVRRIEVELSDGNTYSYEGYGIRPDRLDPSRFDEAWKHVARRYKSSTNYAEFLYEGTLTPARKQWAERNRDQAITALQDAQAALIERDGSKALKLAAVTYFRFAADDAIAAAAAEMVAQILALARQNPEQIIFWLTRVADTGASMERFASDNSYSSIHELDSFHALLNRSHRNRVGSLIACDKNSSSLAGQDFINACNEALSSGPPLNANDKTNFMWSRAYLNRAAVQLELGNESLALQDLRAAQRLDPSPRASKNQIQIALEITKLLHRSGNIDAALKELDMLIESIRDPQALQMRAAILIRNGEFARAREDLTSMLALNDAYGPEQRQQILAERAKIALKLGDARAALNDLNAALEISPHPSLLNSRAQLLAAAGQYQHAVNDYRKILQESSLSALDRAQVHMRMGLVYHYAGDSANAVQNMDQAFASMSDTPELKPALAHIIRVLKQSGHYSGSSSNYDAAVRDAIAACTNDASCRLQ